MGVLLDIMEGSPSPTSPLALPLPIGEGRSSEFRAENVKNSKVLPLRTAGSLLRLRCYTHHLASLPSLPVNMKPLITTSCKEPGRITRRDYG
jgi:hypothetical protein